MKCRMCGKKRYEMKIHWPWKNLGCFGISVGRNIYVDFFFRPFIGMFLKLSNKSWMVSKSGVVRRF